MFKNLKALKIHSRKKNEDKEKDNSHPKKNKWTKPKVPGLKKLKETMGNLTPSMFHGQHYIENADEHATKAMAELERMRQNGTLCDLTVKKCDGGKVKAHKIVVSFNDKLLQMTTQTPEETESQITSDVTYGVSNDGFDEKTTKPSDDVAVPIVSQDELGALSTSQSDTVKQDETTESDVINVEQEKDVPQPEAATDGAKAEESQNQNDPAEGDDVTKSSDDEITQVNGDDEVVDGESLEPPPTATVDDVTSSDGVIQATGEEQSTEIGATETAIDLETEPQGAIGGETSVNISDSCDVNIDDDVMVTPVSLEDPLEVLINFFYTSHINITQKNVTKLRIVARQCGIDDVTMACDEFENVLRTETENMETAEEKDEAASQFRYQYSDPQMPVKMLEHFEKLRHHSRHIDVNVMSLNTSHKYPAHAALLLAATEYFVGSLAPQNTTEFIKTDVTFEANGDVIKEVTMPGVSDAIIQHIITYIYTAKVPVSSHNIHDLMDAAKLLKFDDVIEGCAEYLEGTVSVQNCIGIQKVAEKYECAKLQNMTTRFIDSNFFAVSRTNDFLSISKEKLLRIISSDSIVTEYPASEGEYHIYEAVKKWVNHDLDSRKQYAAEVIRGVRLPLISEKNLVDHISTDLLVTENDALCKRVSRVMVKKSSGCFEEQVPMRGEDFILMIGGSVPVDDETSDEQGYTAVAFNDYVTLFNVQTGKTCDLTHLPETRSLHCALTVDHYVIIAGGFDKYSCITNAVYCLDLSDISWTNLPKMKTKRAWFPMFQLDGCFYAAGGLTPSGYSNKVERYDRKKQKWEYVSQLPRTYYRHGGCEYMGELMISGGNEKGRDVLKYEPSNDKWQPLKPLNFGRDSHVMTNVQDKIYVIGGDADNLPIEVYDWTTEHWQVLSGILNIYGDRLYIPGAACYEDKIYLVGGWRGDDDACDDIKCFNATTERWESAMTILPFPRASLSASRVRLPKNYFGKTVQSVLKEK